MSYYQLFPFHSRIARSFISTKKRKRYRAVIQSFERLAEIYWFQNDARRGIEPALRGLNTAEMIGETSGTLRGYGTACLAFGILRFHPISRYYLRLGKKVLKQFKVDTPTPSRSWFNLTAGAYLAGIGNRKEALEMAEVAEKDSEAIKDYRTTAEALGIRGHILAHWPNYPEALNIYSRLTQLGGRGDSQIESWGLQGTILCQFSTGNLLNAKQSLEQIENLLTSLDLDVASLNNIYG